MKKSLYLAVGVEYGLKLKSKTYSRRHPDIETINFENISRLIFVDRSPIIRDLSDLIKPIVQANYNGGLPFIPIMELLKMKYKEDADRLRKINEYESCPFQDDYKAGVWIRTNDTIKLDMLLGKRSDLNQTWITLNLISWHFWPNMPEGEQVVYVTDEFNPYK